MRSIIRAAVTALALATVLSACTVVREAKPQPSSSQAAPETDPPQLDVPEPEPTAEWTDDPYTDLAVELSWGTQEVADKQAMCDSIDLFGLDWAAEIMQEGFDASDASDYEGYGPSDLDADRAAFLISVKCDEEGY